MAFTICRADKFGVLTGVLDLVPPEFDTVAIGPALYKSAAVTTVEQNRCRSRAGLVAGLDLSWVAGAFISVEQNR